MDVLCSLMMTAVSLALPWAAAHYYRIYVIDEKKNDTPKAGLTIEAEEEPSDAGDSGNDTGVYTEDMKKKAVKKYTVVLLAVFIAALICGFIEIYFGRLKSVKVFECIFLWECVFAISSVDIKVKKIPTALIRIGLACRGLGIILERVFLGSELITLILFSLVGGIIGGGVLLLCKLFAGSGVGMGDVRIYALVGFTLGLAGVINVMFYSMIMAALTGTFLMVFKKAQKKTQIAMAPFVSAGLSVYLLSVFI